MAGLDVLLRQPVPSSDIEGQYGASEKDETRLRLSVEATELPQLVFAKDGKEPPAAKDEKASEPRKETVKLDNGNSVAFVIGANDKVTEMKADSRTFTRRGNSDVWDVRDTNGSNGQWMGEIELTSDGGYSFQSRGDQTKNTVTKSGNIIASRPDGSAVESAGTAVVAVTYPDKSSRSFGRDKGELTSFKDTDGNTWQKDATRGDFVNAANGNRRSGVSVNADGVFTYTEATGVQHSVSRTGRDTIKNTDGSSIEVINNQVEKIKRVSGTTVDCVYDNQKRLLSLTIDGDTKYSRTDGASTDWTFSTKANATRNPWKGNIEVLADGTCVYTAGDQSKEHVQPGGKRWVERADKSRIDLNADNKVEKITRPDGSNIQCEYKDGKLTKITEDWVRSKAVWERKAGTERWYSMDYPGAQRINLDVNKSGAVSYDSVGGTKYTVNSDASQLREKEDGSRIELDSFQRVMRSKLADKTELKCGYDANTFNRLEETKNGTTVVWNRDATTGVWTSPSRAGESRRHVAVDGDAGYRYVELKNDEVSAIRYIDGNLRAFERDAKNITKVSETTPSGTVTWNQAKGSDSWGNGSVTEDRTGVQVSTDGEYKFVRDDGLTQKYLLDGTEDLEPKQVVSPEKVEKASAKLWDVIQKNLPDADQKNFQKDMEAFYRRASILQVSDDQVAKTFDAITSLIEHDDKTSYLKKDDRLELAKQVMRHVAYPRAVDQGYHDTCNVTTVQVVLAARHPEKFADVVREVATTAKFTTTNGTKFDIDAQSMRPDWQSKLYKPYDPARNNYGRSFASQLFQVTAVNAYYSSKGLNRRYEQRAGEGPEDTGERLIDTTNGSVVARVPSLTCDNMKDACIQVSGVACNILESNRLNDTNVSKFASSQDLQTQLLDLQKKNKLPAIIMVNMKQEPYWTETGKGRSGGAPGWHVVTIWNVDRSGKVLVDNQWGRRSDNEGLRRMTVQQIYQAGQP